MQKILRLTLLVSGLTFSSMGSLFAQAPNPNNDAPSTPTASDTPTEVIVPEGFERQSTVLTAEELKGATIYDISGASIGTVHDLVIGMDVAQSGGADRESTPGATKTETIPEQQSTSPPVSPASNSLSDTSKTADTVTGQAIEGTGSTTPSNQSGAQQTTEGMSKSAATTQSGTDILPREASDAAANPTEGQVTHAVIDVGGFLGMGEHRTAIPIQDLAIFRSTAETRIYLPWSREQLEQLPVFNQDDPATLGRSMVGDK